MAFIQYLKDTRGELNHVAWPTRVQTVIFTVLVIALSIVISLYLGLFDYLFTTGLGKAVELIPTRPGMDLPIIASSTPDIIISTTTVQ